MDLKFLISMAASPSRNFKSKTALESERCQCPFDPKFASERAASSCERRNRNTRESQWASSRRRRQMRRVADFDRFRLRRFVEDLGDELATVNEPTDLADVANILEGNPKAVLFRAVGPERQELVGNVTGSRARIARAFGVEPKAAAAGAAAAPAQQARHRRGVARRGAGAGGRADRRRCRSHRAAGASRARRRRRPLHLLLDRFRRRSRRRNGPMWACAG